MEFRKMRLLNRPADATDFHNSHWYKNYHLPPPLLPPYDSTMTSLITNCDV